MKMSLDYSELLQDLRTSFADGIPRLANFRLKQLRSFLRMIEENEAAIHEALKQDMNRCQFEADLCDILITRNELIIAIENLESWMKPESCFAGVHNVGNPAFRKPEPLGVVLIIGTWNYPFVLTFGPLIGAIAAGNCVVVKPSEVAAHSSALIARLLPAYLDNRCYRVVEGAVPETTALLEQKFEHIFYTGNKFVGCIVMKAAAKHVTPVTLELGGKSPVIIDDTSNLEVTAHRILSGKLMNNGQTCIAPDYVLVLKKELQSLLGALGHAYEEFYDGNSLKSVDCASVINKHHFLRLKRLKDSCSGTVALGGREEDANLEFTVIVGALPGDALMQEEIFGPILPILPVNSIEEAIRFVNARPRPLAAYLFSRDKSLQSRVVEEIPCGGMTINDCMIHYSVHDLPFGGVGDSGFGSYHARASFETFSHYKSVIVCKQKLEFLFKALRYPPYNPAKSKRVNWLLAKQLRSPLFAYLPWILVATLAAVVVKLCLY